MNPTLRYFAVCQASDIDFAVAVRSAALVDQAADVFASVGVWDAVVAFMLGESEPLRSYGIPQTTLDPEAWRALFVEATPDRRLRWVVHTLERLT